MPGSLGQSDLYKVELMEDGQYGLPQNLGNQINTEGRETFPFYLLIMNFILHQMVILVLGRIGYLFQKINR